jgi:uncharacterized RDD family membrane protein YckC
MNPPAGFWRRYAAYSADAAAIALLCLPWAWLRVSAALPSLHLGYAQLQQRLWELMDASLDSAAAPMALLLGWAADPTLRHLLAALAAQLAMLALWLALGVFAVAAAWFIASEASPWQASPGKRLLGLRVTDVDGRRCGPGRTTLRFFAGVLSWALLNLGHAMAAFTPGKRALHDLIAGTRVELAPGAKPAMPPAARGWLWLQLFAMLATLSWVAMRYLQLLWEASQSRPG